MEAMATTVWDTVDTTLAMATMATPAMVMDILDMVMAIVAMGMVTKDSQDSSMGVPRVTPGVPPGDLSHIVALATTADSTT